MAFKKSHSIIDQEWLVYMSNLDFEQLRRLPTEWGDFSRLVKDECCKLGVRRVVDVGCGLGHMLDFLSSKCSKDQPIESVGIETNQQFCSSAKKRYGDFTI
uniref:Methyltransferase domain-containing protein n=1 Tax=Ditylenchus dipsaci TaxID=166011 RepID=A0A915DA04_9BILA